MGLDHGSHLITQMLLLNGKPRDSESIDFIMDYMEKQTRWFKYSYHARENEPYFYIQNTLGEKWRSFLEGWLTMMFRLLESAPRRNS